MAPRHADRHHGARGAGRPRGRRVGESCPPP